MAKRKDELLPAKENLPTMGDDEFASDAGAGLENTRPEERRPAFIYLLQQGSKAAIRGGDQYIEGAQPGMFYSTGSGRLFDQVEFIAIKRSTEYLEWIKIEDGGGFVTAHEPDSEFVRSIIRTDKDRFSKPETPDGHQLIQTQTIFCLAGTSGFTLSDAELVAIPMTSIKIKAYGNWFDASKRLVYTVGDKAVHPDIYRHRWLMTSVFEQKWKPSGSWNIRIALAAPTKEQALIRTSDPLYPELRALFEEANAGKLRADYSKERAPGEDLDDEIPM